MKKIFILFLVSISVRVLAGTCDPHLWPTSERFNKLSPAAQAFWVQVGLKTMEVIKADFQRPSNKKAYKIEIEREHPQWLFLKSLGFTAKVDGEIEAPPFTILLENLLNKVDVINEKLRALGESFQIDPDMYIPIKEGGQKKEKVFVLKMLQEFSPPQKFDLIARTTVLDEFSYSKAIGFGRSPFGSIEVLSPPGLFREELKKNPVDTPVIMSLFHDLAHFAVFERNLDFALSYAFVYKHFAEKAMALTDGKKREQYLNEIYGPNESRIGVKLFMYSESSWVTLPDYKKLLKNWPTVKKVLNYEGPLQSQFIHQLDTEEKSHLHGELEQIRNHWWKLFNPLGGVVSDIISIYGFRNKDRFTIYRVLWELEQCLSSTNPFSLENESRLAIVLAVLAHSQKLNVKIWQDYALSEDAKKTELVKLLKQMFPQEHLAKLNSWNLIKWFLYETSPEYK